MEVHSHILLAIVDPSFSRRSQTLSMPLTSTPGLTPRRAAPAPVPSKTTKNIIVCCDGTWQTKGQRDQGVPCPSNVAKIYNALAKDDQSGVAQKAYYHPGVGAGFEDDVAKRVLGGAVGTGLEENVMSAYAWLAQEYSLGDKIFIFGWSRGAFTARYVADMICKYGLADFATHKLPDSDVWERAKRILDASRNEEKPEKVKDIDFFYTPKGASPVEGSTPVHFLGVWDTVGALGVPEKFAVLRAFFGWLLPVPFRLKDTKLSDGVQQARHALAMDERRETFTPTLWTETGERETGEHPSVKQIWFPGDHGDVGGGHLQCGLSDGALQWMMNEAAEQGLAFRGTAPDFPELCGLRPNWRDVLHKSDDGVFGFLPTQPRAVPQLHDGATAFFHASAIDRWKNPPIDGDAPTYWPTRALEPGKTDFVDVYARENWSATGFYLEKGAQYDLTAEGEWVDADIPCDANGPKNGQFLENINPKIIQEKIIQMAGSGLGELEKLLQNATHNPNAQFILTKRVEEYEWFALVGVIANRPGTDGEGNPQAHQTFKIGTSFKGSNRGSNLEPQESGYLYCFANDAWWFYGNNRGRVRLTIKRVK